MTDESMLLCLIFQENFLSLEYRKYLEEIIQVLESDENFKAEIDKMDADADLAVSCISVSMHNIHLTIIS